MGGGVVAAMMAISPALAGPTVAGISTHVVTATTILSADSVGQAEATCGAGELLVGGGYLVNDTSPSWQMFIDAPLDGTTWLAEAVNLDLAQQIDLLGLCDLREGQGHRRVHDACGASTENRAGAVYRRGPGDVRRWRAPHRRRI